MVKIGFKNCDALQMLGADLLQLFIVKITLKFFERAKDFKMVCNLFDG